MAVPIAGALYAVLSPRLAEPVYRPTLFNPHKYPSGNYQRGVVNDVRARDVIFPTANGRKLHGWLFSRNDASKSILINHGNTGNIADLHELVSLLLQSGASVFVYDYQGYGKSEGSPSVRGICDDGLAAYDWLVSSEKVAPDDLVLYGESLGASVSCYVSERRNVSGLILQSSFSTLRRIAGESFPLLRIYPPWLFPRPYFDNLSVLRKAHPPLLVLHGLKDTEVSPAHADALFSQACEPKALVHLPNTQHSEVDAADARTFVEAVRSFLCNLRAPENGSLSLVRSAGYRQE